MPDTKENLRIKNEKVTVKAMVALFCKSHHKNSIVLCSDCTVLVEYAFLKLDKCSFGKMKPACSKCVVHCYRPDMRSRIKEVMRYSGPRMIYNHPVIAVKHLIIKRISKSK